MTTLQSVIVSHFKEKIRTLNSKEANALRYLEREQFGEFVREMMELRKYAVLTRFEQQLLHQLTVEMQICN